MESKHVVVHFFSVLIVSVNWVLFWRRQRSFLVADTCAKRQGCLKSSAPSVTAECRLIKNSLRNPISFVFHSWVFQTESEWFWFTWIFVLHYTCSISLDHLTGDKQTKHLFLVLLCCCCSGSYQTVFSFFVRQQKLFLRNQWTLRKLTWYSWAACFYWDKKPNLYHA